MQLTDGGPLLDTFKYVESERAEMERRFHTLTPEEVNAYCIISLGQSINNIDRETSHKRGAVARNVLLKMLRPDERPSKTEERRALLAAIFWRYLSI
jgi:hypothetical protein